MGIKMDEALKRRLKALGELRDRSPHWIAKKAIEEYLDREEAYEAQKREDMDRWGQYVLTGAYVSQERMDAWLRELAEGRDAPCPEVEVES